MPLSSDGKATVLRHPSVKDEVGFRHKRFSAFHSANGEKYGKAD